jgi:hypothetical protein
MCCSGSHLGIPINIKNTKFVKDLPMIDFQLGPPNLGFYSDIKFKMAAMAELSLTLNLVGKCFKTLLY